MLNASGTAMPSAPTMFLSLFMQFPPIIILRYRPSLAVISTLYLRRRFTARFALAFVRARFAFAETGVAFLATGAGLAVLLATRIDQYSQDRVRPVVLPVISPANLVSPAERVAMLEPRVMARTWYSAFLAE